jgi:hypothetical protein
LKIENAGRRRSIVKLAFGVDKRKFDAVKKDMINIVLHVGAICEFLLSGIASSLRSLQ